MLAGARSSLWLLPEGRWLSGRRQPAALPDRRSQDRFCVIRVNDRHDVRWREGLTVSDLLERMGYSYHQIIVKVNGELVQKESHDTYTIPDGADVKAIHLIAGG
ncbi:MAG: sulfur carrier protein ThiS [Anaerolineae bacterium]|jgi:sulfur carrier protein